jgi:hypothetical protein
MRYNLRAENEAELMAALRAAAVIDQWGRPAAGVTLDVIGTIYKETGEVLKTEAGLPYPVVEAVPGCHANMIADLTPEQLAALPIIPAPKNPYRIFAGE